MDFFFSFFLFLGERRGIDLFCGHTHTLSTPPSLLLSLHAWRGARCRSVLRRRSGCACLPTLPLVYNIWGTAPFDLARISRESALPASFKLLLLLALGDALTMAVAEEG